MSVKPVTAMASPTDASSMRTCTVEQGREDIVWIVWVTPPVLTVRDVRIISSEEPSRIGASLVIVIQRVQKTRSVTKVDVVVVNLESLVRNC